MNILSHININVCFRSSCGFVDCSVKCSFTCISFLAFTVKTLACLGSARNLHLIDTLCRSCRTIAANDSNTYPTTIKKVQKCIILTTCASLNISVVLNYHRIEILNQFYLGFQYWNSFFFSSNLLLGLNLEPGIFIPFVKVLCKCKGVCYQGDDIP